MAQGVDRLIARRRAEAENRVDAAVFDFFAGGSDQEIALAEAGAAWASFRFLPHVLRDVSKVDVSCLLFGQRLASPIAVAPIAYQGLLHVDGEVATARGARDANSLFILSTRSSRTVEEVAAAAGPWWLQVYVTADRTLTEGIVRRAATCGATALVLTGDTPYLGRKARGGRPDALGSAATMANLGPHLRPGSDPESAAEQDPSVDLAAIAWLAELSGLPVLVKGVLRADDAADCLAAGASGLIVSNHGGRQLDRTVPTALALEEVVAAAGDAPVLVDGGLSSGRDVLVALALGARAVLVGRPVAWALASGGADGVAELLTGFAADLRHDLGLAGYRNCGEVGRDLVRLVR